MSLESKDSFVLVEAICLINWEVLMTNQDPLIELGINGSSFFLFFPPIIENLFQRDHT